MATRQPGRQMLAAAEYVRTHPGCCTAGDYDSLLRVVMGWVDVR